MLGKLRSFDLIYKIAKHVKISPNVITLLSLIFGLSACIFLYLKNLLIAGVLILLNGFFDALDGAVARIHRKTSLLGEFFDAISDKYTEALILLSFLFVDAPCFLISLCIIGVLLTSYAQARLGEVLGRKKAFKGFGLERSERILILGFGCIVSSFFNIINYVLLFIAIFSNFTAMLRSFYSMRILKNK